MPDLAETNLEGLYERLINVDELLAQLDDLKQSYNNQLHLGNLIIPILKRARNYWYGQRQWLIVELIEEFVLQITVQEEDPVEIIQTLLRLLNCLEMQRTPQSCRKIINLGEEYLPKDLSIPIRIIIIYDLMKASLNLYGVSDQSLKYYLAYTQAISKCDQCLLEDEIDSAFYKVIYVGSPCLYFFDNPRNNNSMRQVLAKLGLSAVRSMFALQTEIYPESIRNRLSKRTTCHATTPLKIGYMTDFLYQHSVGWLVRWTLQYHDPEKFDVYTYSTFKLQDKVYNGLVKKHGEKIRYISGGTKNVMNKIQEDEIDILIDLGSLTEATNCMVLAVKPAPIQMTWLGSDASQISTVDYYLADRYSLPDEAQEYYQERIVKLPNCYIAVDGFEVDRPSLTRRDLEIPDHAVIYLSSQVGPKRHPNNMKLQIQILSQVPNSYFLVKFRRIDEEIALENFIRLAFDMGIESDRIKVIPSTPTSEIHRANLKIADVILDTYPYNGATTTLEALWCEVPLVTRVGQQFAARNSYSMLMNAGVTEGIAWTDEEYVNWGVIFGLNRDLRDRVRWKLRQSKRSSPLWDARQFTRDLEQVYQQIWDGYLNKRNFAQRLA